MTHTDISFSSTDTRRYRQLKNNGFSLVELLVATAVGLVLLSGMFTVLQGNLRSSDLNSSMSDIQESARFAMNRLADSIRMSGFQGCLDVNSGAAVVLSNDKPTINLSDTAAYASVISADNSWNPAPPNGFSTGNHTAVPGTHALVLQYGDPATYPLFEQLSSGGIPDPNGPVVVDTSPGISARNFDLVAGDFALISNCSYANIFQITSVAINGNTASIGHDASLNETSALGYGFGDASSIRETRVMRFVSNVFYVGDTGLTNDAGNSITALYQQSLPYGDVVNNPPVELIRGVENLRISFGVRTGSESMTYMQPDDPVFDPAMVASIRLGLLMSSYDTILQDNDTNTYVLAGQAVTKPGASDVTHAGDKRYRLAFNTTIKIRNRRNTYE
ncbi:MAG: PilW family protein [Granulosicoccus sp.]